MVNNKQHRKSGRDTGGISKKITIQITLLPSNLLLIMCFLCSTACERSIDWEVEDAVAERLVVEAILTNEFRIQEINLSTSFNGLNGETPNVVDADVKVEANGIIYPFDVDQDRYLSREAFSVVDGLEYRLVINWAGQEYTALSNLSAVAPIPLIGFLPFGQRDSVFISKNVVPLFSSSQQAMYQFDVDWSHIQTQGLSQVRLFYYTFNSVHNSQFIRPEVEDVVFPVGSIVTVSKFGLNDDFAAFLRAQVIETDWNGAILYGNPENAPSNITNDGLGFFTTCSVLRDTLLAE